MLHGGVLEISPLAYMRGRTFKRAFIIADEMQNSTPNQMVMLMTRLGDHSKMVITGDLYQSDRGMQNGLSDFLEKMKKETKENHQKEEYKENQIKYVELDKEDIQRSPIVSRILDIYNTTQPQTNSSIIITRPITPIIYKDDAAMMPKSQIPKSI
jgi:phosphate starvation-inducible PhoH-like protein